MDTKSSSSRFLFSPPSSPLKAGPPGDTSALTLFDKWVTKRQLAEHLAVSESFINKQMKQGGLPYIALGRSVRFSIQEVVAWLQKRRRP
jgi:excisionase family DNA binding protein